MHVEKTHGCHPSGTGCDAWCGNAKIITATWYPGVLEITVNMTYSDYPQAYGHFTFHDDSGHSDRILGDQQFVNCQHCDKSLDCQVNPYTSSWKFDASQTPQKGVWYDIWISVYWQCYTKFYNRIRCLSEDIHYRGQVPL
ncbi:hypothetical protein F8M41_024078 [Gigaspora margarita]|uniref:Uncharacterized protein n=1 Tax=Gigaspora margarita TaxID=4874 RepID=A0A8H4ACA8_GIGMA|nr:hypothetical protein F8M41_024078 [Gigaspora margarita]